MTEDFNNNILDYFPSPSGNNQNLISFINQTTEMLCKWYADSENNPILPINTDLDFAKPNHNGCNSDQLLDDIRFLIKHSFNPIHPGSLAYLDPPPLLISIVGDLISSGLNNNLLAEELSPGISVLESQICDWFAKAIGYDSYSGGIAASGGSLNNLNALVTARYSSGLSSDPNATFIMSEDAHVSFKKCGRILGLSDRNIIIVGTDKSGKIDIQLLNNLINKSLLEGKKIFAVVATLGTTFRGAIDPIDQISKICKVNNIWLHIDGSIGGIYSLSSKDFFNMGNINNADSITINPQKILGIAKTSSLLLVKNINSLKETFKTGLPYIDSPEETINRGELGIQGSRPSEIIKLWLGLRFLGINGIDKILKVSIKKKELFINNLDKDKFEISSGPLHIVSFIPKHLDKQKSDNWTSDLKEVLLKKNYMISRPLYKGRNYLRVVFGNYNTKQSHIYQLTNLLNEL